MKNPTKEAKYLQAVAYLPGSTKVEPWQPNVTALHDSAALKWRQHVKAGTPLPTPWPKELFTKRANEFQERRKRIRFAVRLATAGLMMLSAALVLFIAGTAQVAR